MSNTLSVSGEQSSQSRVLARVFAHAEGETRDFLGFALADEHYAVPLSSVQEIMKLPPVTEVPRAAPSIMGIISVRGRVTTLVDMRRRLGLPSAAIDARVRVLLVDSGEEVIGLLVDRVLQVYRLQEHEVEAPGAAGGESGEHIMGIARPGLRTRPRSGRTVGALENPALPRSEETADAREGAQTDVNAEILILLDPTVLLKS